MASWPEPNYKNPHTRGDGALIVNIVCVACAFVVTALRLFTRVRITYSPGLDDVFIIIGMV